MIPEWLWWPMELAVVCLIAAVVWLLLRDRRWASALRRKAETLAAITENITEALLILDGEGRVTAFNTDARRLLGGDQLHARQDVRRLHPDPDFDRLVTAALRGEHREQLVELQKKRCQLILHPIREGERVTGAVLLVADVTEKEGREQLRREFTANVSHELKTPLTSISGFAEIIKDGIAREEDVQRFASNIYNESQRLINLVEDIIKLSRLDENPAPVDREWVDMGQLIRATLDRLQPLAAQKQVALELGAASVCVYGVPRILDEIVFNLCENAVKYNRPRGRVMVTMTQQGGCPVFRVSDTGIGIPAADQKRVFERFYRVDKSHSRAIGGTGLGLSIVKHGVLYHDGTITLESEPEVGTTITVTFPAEGE